MSDGKFSIPRDSIPANWTVCRVQDAGTVQLGRQRSPKDHTGPHMRPYLRAANVLEDRIDISDVKEMNFTPEEFENFRLREGDILLNEGQSLELVGRPAMFRGEVADCCFQNTLVRFVPTPVLDGKFALKLFQHYMRNGRFQKIARWTTNIAHLGASRFAELEIPLPPLAEQKRIVAKIEELFSELEAGEESLRVARRQLGVYRQSLLKQAFEGKLTAQWRTQNPAQLKSPAQLLARIKSARQSRYEDALKKWDCRSRSNNLPKQARPRPPLPATPLEAEILSGLSRLPDGWTWAKMEDTCDIVRGGSPRPAGDPKYYDGEIPFLKVADLTRVDGPYVDNFTSTIKPAGLQKTRYIEPPVLLISNSGATLGVPRICRIAATFNDGVAAFLDLDPESHRYFYYFWTSKTEALRNIDQGAAQPNLNTDLLKTYPVPLCSLPEQQEIVRLLDEQFEVIERNERELDAALQRSEALRQAILKKAFTGRLIPQSPADEPASTLLARLRAERETTLPAKRAIREHPRIPRRKAPAS